MESCVLTSVLFFFFFFLNPPPVSVLQVSGRKSPDSSFRSEKVLKKGYDKVGRVNQTFFALTLTHAHVVFVCVFLCCFFLLFLIFVQQAH